MRRWLAGIIACGMLACGQAARAEDDDITKLRADWEAAQKKWGDAARKAEESGKEVDASTYPARDFRDRYRKVAEKHAGKADVIPVLVWLIEHTDESGPDTAGAHRNAQWAVAQLTQHHAADPAIKDELRGIAYSADMIGVDETVAFFQGVIDANKDRETRSEAMLCLGMVHLNASGLTGDADETKPVNRARMTMAKKLFHGLTEAYVGTKAAELASGYLTEIQTRQIGMKAPDIVGNDADGKEIRLSQFAGKVVIIDFWGFW